MASSRADRMPEREAIGRKSTASVGRPVPENIQSLGIRESCSAFFVAAMSCHGLYGVARFVLTGSQPEVSTPDDGLMLPSIVSGRMCSGLYAHMMATTDHLGRVVTRDRSQGSSQWLHCTAPLLWLEAGVTTPRSTNRLNSWLSGVIDSLIAYGPRAVVGCIVDTFQAGLASCRIRKSGRWLRLRTGQYLVGIENAGHLIIAAGHQSTSDMHCCGVVLLWG